MSQAPLRLKYVYFQGGVYFQQGGFPRSFCARVGRLDGVLAWFFAYWLIDHRVECRDFSSIEIFPAMPGRGDVFFPHGKTLRVGVEYPHPQRFAHLTDDEAIYQFLFELTERGLAAAQSRTGVEPSALSAAITEFRANSYRFTRTLARKKPRGLGLEFTLEAEVDAEALKVDFVARRGTEIIYREALVRTSPYSFILRGALKSITFDGATVSIPGHVPTDGPGKLVTIPDTTEKTELRRLEHYTWSRKLSDIVGQTS